VALTCGGFGVSLIAFAFSRYSGSRRSFSFPRVLHHAGDGLFEHADPIHGPDALARRVMAVYSMMFMAWHLSVPCWGGKSRIVWVLHRCRFGGVASIVGAFAFGRKLPVFAAMARQLIIAQEVAGGEPSQEMTAGRWTRLGSRSRIHRRLRAPAWLTRL